MTDTLIANGDGEEDQGTKGRKSKTPDVTPVVEVSRIDAETITVPIVGTSPLIVHRFSEKAKRMMLDNMQGRKSPKVSKDPEADYQDAFYVIDEGRLGFPATAFKLATIGGARYYSQVTMVALKMSLFVHGEMGSDGLQLVEITGEPHMREDVVRLSGRGSSTDLRYRPQFDEWSTALRVTYVKAMLTRESVLSLIDAGGLGVGVGEWRPERGGDFGTYTIDESREIEVVR
jgi:hypothetical protein